jgi:biopolymer transport protein ExbD
MSKKETAKLNTGSMADMAFLLLISFLVTTTMNLDSGIQRKITEKPKDNFVMDIKKKNILEVNINVKKQRFLDGKIIQLQDLEKIIIDFIDNGGGLNQYKRPCHWREGRQSVTSSDHPSKAFISIKADRNTNYKTNISVLNHLNTPYIVLRNKVAAKLYDRNYVNLLIDYKTSNYKDESLEMKIKTIRKRYPLLLSDAEIKN